MKILGQIKSSFIDYPGKISTVIFIGGCNFKCGYCHNPDLVKNKGDIINQQDILSFLEKRKKYLDGVCISGGEPTLYHELYSLIKEIKKLQYCVKLDTNGTNSDMLLNLLEDNLVDYVAMDIKAPLLRYKEVAGQNVDIKKIEQSISLLLASNIDYEFRTTVAKEFISEADLENIAQSIQDAKRYCIQNFKKIGQILEESKVYTPFSLDELDKMKNKINKYVQQIIVR